MRIAFNASIVDHLLSGVGEYAVNLLEGLAKLHDDLVVYTSCPKECNVDLAKMRKIGFGVQPSLGRRDHFQRLIWTQTVLPLRLLADKASLLLSPLPLMEPALGTTSTLPICPRHISWPWRPSSMALQVVLTTWATKGDFP